MAVLFTLLVIFGIIALKAVIAVVVGGIGVFVWNGILVPGFDVLPYLTFMQGWAIAFLFMLFFPTSNIPDSAKSEK